MTTILLAWSLHSFFLDFSSFLSPPSFSLLGETFVKNYILFESTTSMITPSACLSDCLSRPQEPRRTSELRLDFPSRGLAPRQVGRLLIGSHNRPARGSCHWGCGAPTGTELCGRAGMTQSVRKSPRQVTICPPPIRRRSVRAVYVLLLSSMHLIS